MIRSAVGRPVALAVVLAACFLASGCAEITERLGSEPKDVRMAAEALQSGDEDTAIARLDQLIAREPKDPEPYMAAAQLLSSARKPAAAARYAAQGLQATPGASIVAHSQLYTLLGAARQALGQFDAAVEANRSALRLAPRDPTTLNNLAYAYAEMPNGGPYLEEAERLASTSVRLAREASAPPAVMGVYLDTLGWVQFKQGKFELASLHLGMAMEAAPDQPDILYHVARAYQAAGRTAAARVVLERALQVMPDHQRARAALEESKLLEQPAAPTGR